jgi:hypothetical protein
MDEPEAHLAACFCWFLVLLFDPEDGGDARLKDRLTFTGLYGVISQKAEPFIVTAVRTSNQIIWSSFICSLFNDAVSDSMVSNDQMIVNNELGRMRKEAVVTSFHVLPRR